MNRRPLSESQWPDVIAAYTAGESGMSIATRFGVAFQTIFRGMAKRGCVARRRTYSLNESFFDVIDNEDKAYFLGLLYADGYNNERLGNVEITLIDRPILEQFAKAIGYGGQIAVRAPKNERCLESYRLTLCSRKLSGQLARLGCGTRKSKTLTFPDWLNENLRHHFIRGYFDGDGSVHVGKPQKTRPGHMNWGIVGTEVFCRSVSHEFVSAFGFPGCIRKSPLCDMWYLGYCGNGRAKLLADYLFRDATLWIDRKRVKFQQVGALAA